MTRWSSASFCEYNTINKYNTLGNESPRAILEKSFLSPREDEEEED